MDFSGSDPVRYAPGGSGLSGAAPSGADLAGSDLGNLAIGYPAIGYPAIGDPAIGGLGEEPTTTPLKIIIAGGFGVGKTTFVGSVSEIPPLTTEAHMTEASLGVDDTSEIAGKTTTTVAMDFGRISLPEQDVVLYLFGTPGQDRFWFMWDELTLGAVGAIVLADTRRLPDSFAAIDFFEDRRVPFVVAVNQFDGAIVHPLGDVRGALDIEHPVFPCDARSQPAARSALIALVRHALASTLADEERASRAPQPTRT